jgi:hypothetical protein
MRQSAAGFSFRLPARSHPRHSAEPCSLLDLVFLSFFNISIPDPADKRFDSRNKNGIKCIGHFLPLFITCTFK